MATTTYSKKFHVAVCAFRLNPAGSSVIQIFPSGEFDAPLGAVAGNGPWLMDAGAASLLIAAAVARGNSIPIDYEHQTLNSTENGQPAPAAGWLEPSALKWRVDGLFGVGVEWTERAAGMIGAGEYRYISPVFRYDMATKKPVALLNMALTNFPAIPGMDVVALAAARIQTTITSQETSSMDELLQILRYALNLPITSTPDEINGELQKIIDQLGGAELAAAKSAGLTLAQILGDLGVAVAAAKSVMPDPAQFAPIELVRELQADIVVLKAKNSQDASAVLIETALAAGKISTPGKRRYAYALAGLDDQGKPVAGSTPNLSALADYLAAEEPIAALRASQTDGVIPVKVKQFDELSESELAVCRSLNVKPEDYKNRKNKNAGDK